MGWVHTHTWPHAGFGFGLTLSTDPTLHCIHLRWRVLHDVTVVRRSSRDEGILWFTVIIAEFTEVEGARSCYPWVVRGRLIGRDIVLPEGGVAAHCQEADSTLLQERRTAGIN